MQIGRPPTPASRLRTRPLLVAGILTGGLAITAIALAIGRGDGGGSAAVASASGVGGILYTIGASTDPYRDSSPGGFGVGRLRGSRFTSVAEVRDPTLGWFDGAAWIDGDRIAVPQSAPPFRRRLQFRLRRDRLERLGPLPLPATDTTVAWSPNRRLVASEPIGRCKRSQTLWECNRQTGRIYVQDRDGIGRRLIAHGHLDSWTPDGRLLVTSVSYNEPHAAVDISSGERELPLDPGRIGPWAGAAEAAVGPPRWSADRRFIAARLSGRWANKQTLSAIVIADASGKPLRLLRSRYVMSMFAWSPTGHRLAYTTSGFPAPHELFVVDDPESPARPVMTTKRHFDWITWAPDSRRLLLDDPVEGLWWLVPAQPPYVFTASPRLGGRPLWCCPVNEFTLR